LSISDYDGLSDKHCFGIITDSLRGETNRFQNTLYLIMIAFEYDQIINIGFDLVQFCRLVEFFEQGDSVAIIGLCHCSFFLINQFGEENIQ
jgi:hypothetical protein